MRALPRPVARRGSESGAAAVEFALVVPLLLILTFGILSYGYMLSFRQAIGQGATEGARAAAVSALPTSAGKISSAVSAVNDSIDSYGVSCTITGSATSGSLRRNGRSVGTCRVTTAACVNNSTADCVSVGLVYDYAANPLLPTLPGVGIVLPDDLGYTAVARVS